MNNVTAVSICISALAIALASIAIVMPFESDNVVEFDNFSELAKLKICQIEGDQRYESCLLDANEIPPGMNFGEYLCRPGFEDTPECQNCDDYYGDLCDEVNQDFDKNPAEFLCQSARSDTIKQCLEEFE